jgi:hypothetical protein
MKKQLKTEKPAPRSSIGRYLAELEEQHKAETTAPEPASKKTSGAGKNRSKKQK